ncbi:MAG: AmmeMemoRadiSam system protein B [Propionibacterium sp.]
MSTRPAAVAGSFYPADPKTLASTVRGLLDAVTPATCEFDPARIKALVVPHAGYVYSGSTAAGGYSLLRGRAISRVVVLGPTHRVAVRGIALPGCEAFGTPLGPLALDAGLVDAVSTLPGVSTRPDVHADEHSLEVQLPFVQLLFPKASILPVAVGEVDARTVAALLDAVWGGPETLLVVSSDLSHFHTWEQARSIDATTIGQILALDARIRPDQACGCRPLNGLLRAAVDHDLTPSLVAARNSGDTAGDRSRVVGYASFAFEDYS